MYVAQLCSRKVALIRSTDDVCAAARLMRERHVGYLVVVEPNQVGLGAFPAGVLTDRDIVVSVVARQVDPRAVTVGDIMSAKPVVVSELDSVHMAVQEMRRLGVRRVPVVNEHGEISGVLSLDDVLEATSRELRDLAEAVGNERRFERELRT